MKQGMLVQFKQPPVVFDVPEDYQNKRRFAIEHEHIFEIKRLVLAADDVQCCELILKQGTENPFIGSLKTTFTPLEDLKPYRRYQQLSFNFME